MHDTSEVSAHYSNESLLQRIEAALARHGAKPPLDLEDLALFDEFHIGGRPATVEFVKKLRITAGCRVLDLGCGLGGPARYIAKTTGARVTGIDLTEDFVQAGRALTGMALMLDRVELVQGDILDLPFEDGRFDVAYMMHVGMNIPDKAALAAQVARVLKPGGVFGIYDVMALSDADITYPVPWASSAEQNALSTPQVYRDALSAAWFQLVSETDRSDLAQAFFARLAAQEDPSGGPPPLGLHLVMGPDTRTKVRNMVAGVTSGLFAPIEMIARLPE